jgi:hypothetical protein
MMGTGIRNLDYRRHVRLAVKIRTSELWNACGGGGSGVYSILAKLLSILVQL